MSFNQTSDHTLELYINSSSDGIQGSSSLSNWTTNFPVPANLESGRYNLAVSSASIANTFPQFHSTERKVRVNTVEFNLSRDAVYSNTGAFTTALTSQMDASSVELVLSVDTLTQRVLLTNDGAGNATIDLAEPYLEFWKKMGYVDTGATELVLTPAQTLLLPYVASLIPTQRVHITCDSIVNNSITPSINNRPIMCCVNIESNFGSYSTQVYPYLYKHDLVSQNSLYTLKFGVYDDKSRLLEMMGGSVNLSILLSKAD